jgi:hypothetical protein
MQGGYTINDITYRYGIHVATLRQDLIRPDDQLGEKLV